MPRERDCGLQREVENEISMGVGNIFGVCAYLEFFRCCQHGSCSNYHPACGSLAHFLTCYLGCLPLKEMERKIMHCYQVAYILGFAFCSKYFVLQKQDTTTISFHCHHWQMQSHSELGDICSAGLGDSQA